MPEKHSRRQAQKAQRPEILGERDVFQDPAEACVAGVSVMDWPHRASKALPPGGG